MVVLVFLVESLQRCGAEVVGAAEEDAQGGAEQLVMLLCFLLLRGWVP